MNSFNAFMQKKANVGGNIPVWLGTVSPLPVGGILAADYAFAGALYPAGSPVYFDEANKAIYPFLAWEVVSNDTSNHVLTVKENALGILPKVGAFIGVVGATFATTGAAEKVNAVAAGATAGTIAITLNSTNIDASVSAGKFIAISAATAAGGSGKSLANQPNGYLYNDIRIDNVNAGESLDSATASGAVVVFHGEGILIERTIGAAFKEQLKAVIPNVIQVLG